MGGKYGKLEEEIQVVWRVFKTGPGRQIIQVRLGTRKLPGPVYLINLTTL